MRKPCGKPASVSSRFAPSVSKRVGILRYQFDAAAAVVDDGKAAPPEGAHEICQLGLALFGRNFHLDSEAPSHLDDREAIGGIAECGGPNRSHRLDAAVHADISKAGECLTDVVQLCFADPAMPRHVIAHPERALLNG